jgi:hypothetical protein
MNEIQKHQGGAIMATDGFGSQSIQTTGSTVEAIQAAREKAWIESRLVIAQRYPRNMLVVRDNLKAAIERPGFADSDMERKGRPKGPGSAWYKLPFGEDVQGFTIRFAEEAIRALGHMNIESQVIWEDDTKRLLQVIVTDLQNNDSIQTQIVIEKTTERKFLRKDDEGNPEIAIRTRITSGGKVNYVVEADEAEMNKKQNSAISKAIRNAVLRFLPGDIAAECRKRILEIRHGQAATDPDGAIKAVADSFSALNVKPDALEEYIGHRIGESNPAEITHLRELYKAIKAGETTWSDVIRETREERGEDPEKPRKGLDGITDKLKSRSMAEPEPVAPEPVERLVPPAANRKPTEVEKRLRAGGTSPIQETTEPQQLEIPKGEKAKLMAEIQSIAKEKYGDAAMLEISRNCARLGFPNGYTGATLSELSSLLDEFNMLIS